MPALKTKFVGAVCALSLSLGACSGPSGPRTGDGIFLGALSGALIGGAANRGPGGVIAGAVIGGLIGGAIGNALDEEDRRRAYEAELRALEAEGPGAPVSWRGDRGAYGTIVAGPPYAYQSYQRCREFTHTVYVNGQPQTGRGIACRNPDGTWTQVQR
jgi:surface antigen